MNTIKFTGKLYPDELFKLSGYVSRTDRWSITNLVGYGILYIAAALFLYFYFALSPYSVSRNTFLSSAIFFLALAILRPPLDRLWLWLKIRNQEFNESTAEFDEECVTLSSVDGGVRLPWRKIYSILSTPAGLVIMLAPGQAWFYLPNRAFTETSSRSGVIDFASKHEIRIRTIG